MYPDIFESATFSFWIKKISTSTRIRIQMEFARPHVSNTYADSLFLTSTQDSYRNIGNIACVVKRAKFAASSALNYDSWFYR